MYPLFFGLLFIAVCNTVGTGDGVVETHCAVSRRDGDASLRNRIIEIATAEIGVREATGNNDGERVEEYLRYTNLGKGHQWCAAFVSWCYGQAGLPQPRNPWSPALFPDARTYGKGNPCGYPPTGKRITIDKADLFAIYGASARRINHVGLVKAQQGQYIVTIEGNSNNRVESRRRHLSTIYALSDWVGD
jgi:hypothetical protein